MHGAIEHISIKKVNEHGAIDANDQVAVEEPLEIRLVYSTGSGRLQKNIAVTMRTPGNDKELAAGFLFTEGVIRSGADIEEIKFVHGDSNRVVVLLKENVQPSLANTSRNFYSTSSCGVCGKASIDAVYTSSSYRSGNDQVSVDATLLITLQQEIRKQQPVFENTGGIHASALFSLQGELMLLMEDVGRHNALDKLIGAALMNGQMPLQDRVLFLSGRAGFELLQKSAMAGLKIVAAVGAPSSLAIDMAKEAGITLIGFLKNDRFNIYTESQRIRI